MKKLSKSYDMLNEFSDKLVSLSLLFKQSVVTGYLVGKMPEITYRLWDIRIMETKVKSLFKTTEAKTCFSHLDSMLFDTERIVRSDTIDEQSLWGCASSIRACADQLSRLCDNPQQARIQSITSKGSKA